VREIKFRAYGHDDGPEYKMFHSLLFDDYHGVLMPKSSDGEIICDHTLMQYTGLKDSKGVEIYEGDILSIHPSPELNGSVVWNNNTAAFCTEHITPNGEESHSDHLYGAEYCEVIGNIHENPELLGAKHV